MKEQEQAIKVIQKLTQKLAEKEYELVMYEAALEEVQEQNEQLAEALADYEEAKKKLKYYDDLAEKAKAQAQVEQKTK